MDGSITTSSSDDSDAVQRASPGSREDGDGDFAFSLELPQYLRVNTTFFCGLVFVVGVFGNLLVPLVIWRNKDMRNSTNLFLVNLSVADLLILLICMPTAIVEIHAKPEAWILGEGMCKAIPFLELTVAHGCVFTILAISFERYYAICKPLTASYKLTQLRGCVIIVLIWLTAGLTTGPVFSIVEYTTRDFFDGSVVPVCLVEIRYLWRKIYIIAVTVIFFFLPLFILIIVYAIIARHLVVAPALVLGSRLADTSNMRARRQVVSMLAAVVIFFFVCLLPFRVFTLWIILSSEEQIENIGFETYYNILFFCRTMLYINSAINPILYNVMSSRFREAFIRVLGCAERNSNRKKLDRQTTFNTTYTSLTSSIKGGRTTVPATTEVHVTTTATVCALPTRLMRQDSAV